MKLRKLGHVLRKIASEVCLDAPAVIDLYKTMKRFSGQSQAEILKSTPAMTALLQQKYFS